MVKTTAFLTQTACILLLAASCSTPPTDLSQVDDTATEASIARGQDLYKGLGCGVCHGSAGHGDGVAVPSLAITPRDLTDGAAYKRGHSARRIAETIRSGMGDPKSPMPVYTHLAAPDLIALGHYLESLQR